MVSAIQTLIKLCNLYKVTNRMPPQDTSCCYSHVPGDVIGHSPIHVFVTESYVVIQTCLATYTTCQHSFSLIKRVLSFQEAVALPHHPVLREGGPVLGARIRAERSFTSIPSSVLWLVQKRPRQFQSERGKRKSNGKKKKKKMKAFPGTKRHVLLSTIR